MSEEHVLGEKKGHIFYLTLNRADKRNALTFEMLAAISQMIEGLMTDSEIRAVIVKGEGPVFSAGVDFNSLAMLASRFMTEAAAGGAVIRAEINKFQHHLNRLETFEIPIICAMHGRALGLAVELSLACDFRLMSDDCLWGMPELRFGVIPDLGGTARLAKLLGPSRAMEILMTGRQYSADQALQWGLADYVYPESELLTAAEDLARDIAKMAPLAVGAVKKVVKCGQGVDLMTQLDMEANLQSILLRSEDFTEGVTALMEKRAPNWKRK